MDQLPLCPQTKHSRHVSQWWCEEEKSAMCCSPRRYEILHGFLFFFFFFLYLSFRMQPQALGCLWGGKVQILDEAGPRGQQVCATATFTLATGVGSVVDWLLTCVSCLCDLRTQIKHRLLKIVSSAVADFSPQQAANTLKRIPSLQRDLASFIE